MSKPVRVEVVMDDGSRQVGVLKDADSLQIEGRFRSWTTLPAPPKVGDRVVLPNGDVGVVEQIEVPDRPVGVLVSKPRGRGYRGWWPFDDLSPAPPPGDEG